MSVAITRSPSENPEIIKRLLDDNLFKVFGQRDTVARTATIAETYHKHVLWHEPDRVVHGWDAMDKRAGELLAEAPGFQFSTDGESIVTQNLGILSWKFGPAADPGLVKGTDVILVDEGKIKVLWTAVTKIP